MRKADQVMIPTNFAENTTGPAVVYHHNLAIKVILQGEEIVTCTCLAITNWEVCPFWLCMADTRSVRPSGLRRKLKIVIGGYTFEISAMVLALDVLGAYALLIGCPWLHLANIKPNWQHNNIRFHRGRGKIRVPMQESTPPMKAMTPLYVEEVHIFKGLEEEELENYLEENLRIVPLFDIDVIEIARAYATPAPVGDEDCTPDMKALMELRRAQDAFD